MSMMRYHLLWKVWGAGLAFVAVTLGLAALATL